MNELNDNLLVLITHLEEIQGDSLDHDLRKKLLLELHQLKVEARKEQADSVTNELLALEYSLGFGQDQQSIQVAEIQEHIQRLLHLVGMADTEDDLDGQIQEQSEEDSGDEAEEVSTDTEGRADDSVTEEPADPPDEQIELLDNAKAVLHLTLCNCKTRDEARAIAHGLVENRYAACVNFIANIGSIYRWQDAVEDTAECQLQIKSVPGRDQDIREYIKAHHSYDVPEIITVPVNQANQEYIEWVVQQTT